MNKEEAKAKRIELLTEIHELEKKRCSKCKEGGQKTGAYNCKCEANMKIRKLGTEYLNIATKARAGRMKQLIRETKKTGLTLEKYRIFREMGMIDKEICQTLKLGMQKFYDWKYENGLMKNPKPSSKIAAETRAANRLKKDA